MLHVAPSQIMQAPPRFKKETTKEHENKKPILPTDTV